MAGLPDYLVANLDLVLRLAAQHLALVPRPLAVDRELCEVVLQPVLQRRIRVRKRRLAFAPVFFSLSPVRLARPQSRPCSSTFSGCWPRWMTSR